MKQKISEIFEKWNQLSKKKQIFLLAWLSGILLLGGALFFEHSSNQRSGNALAMLSTSKGQVQYRDANELLWQSSNNNQKFFENDSVATGSSSVARVAFIGGRILELGPNTQIRITRSIADNEETFSVDLMQGEVKALPVNQTVKQRIAQRLGRKAVTSKKTTEIKIAASGQTFSLRTETAALTLQKPKEAKEVKVVAAKKVEKIVQGKREEVVAVKIEPKKAEPAPERPKVEEKKVTEAAPSPVAEPPKQEVELKKLDAPKIQAEKVDLNIKENTAQIEKVKKPEVHSKNLESLSAKKLHSAKLAKNNIKMGPSGDNMLLAARAAPPSSAGAANKKLLAANSPQQLIPSLDFQGKGSVLWVKQPLEAINSADFGIKLEPPSTTPKGVDWIPVAGFGGKIYPGKPSFTAQEISVIPQSLGAKKGVSSDSFNELSFKIAPGVILEKDGKALKDVEFGAPQIVRFRSLASLSGPTIMQVNTIAEKPWSSEYLSQSDSAAVSVYLQDTTQLIGLSDFLPGSEGFTFKKGSLPLSGQGTFIVKNRHIVGAIHGEAPKGKGLDALLKKLGADMIFNGNSNSYIGGPQALQKRMEAEPLEKIYIAYQNDFVGVNRNFLQTNPEAKKFIMSQSSSFFTEPIKLLAPSQDQ